MRHVGLRMRIGMLLVAFVTLLLGYLAQNEVVVEVRSKAPHAPICGGCVKCKKLGHPVDRWCSKNNDNCIQGWRELCASEQNNSKISSYLGNLGCAIHPPCDQPGTQQDGAIVVLHYEDPKRWDMFWSICKHLVDPYPLIVLQTENELAATREKENITSIFRSKDCAVNTREVIYSVVPSNKWIVGQEHFPKKSTLDKKVGNLSYRRMIWFWNYVIFHLPVLSPYKYLMRLDTDSVIRSTPLMDPITHVALENGIYGYLSFCYDSEAVTRGLYKHLHKHYLDKMREVEAKKPHHPMHHITATCLRDAKGCRVPQPMFYNNFEVVDTHFFKRPDVQAFLNSTYRGVFSARWGDAPLRAAALALFGSSEKLVHINTFEYQHGKVEPGVFPIGNVHYARWDAWQKGFPWENKYFQGHCYHPPPKKKGKDCRLITQVEGIHGGRVVKFVTPIAYNMGSQGNQVCKANRGCEEEWSGLCAAGVSADNITAALRAKECTVNFPPCHNVSTVTQPTGAIVVLHFEDPRRWDMFWSICKHLSDPYPLVMLQTENELATVEEKENITSIFASEQCTTHEREIIWTVVPLESWNVGQEFFPAKMSKSKKLGNLSYRRMIWFWNYVIFHLPVLSPYKYLMRLDTDSVIRSTPLMDPITHVALENGIYGYLSFCYDPYSVTMGLSTFLKEAYPLLVKKTRFYIAHGIPAACLEDSKCKPPHPMFYNNFEVVDTHFFKRPDVQAFLNSTYRGVFSARWGDAPLRAAALALFGSSEKLVHINTFEYQHGKVEPGVFPIGNVHYARWGAWLEEFPWKDPYFGGLCQNDPPRPECYIKSRNTEKKHSSQLEQEICMMEGVIEGEELTELSNIENTKVCYSECKRRSSCSLFTFYDTDEKNSSDYQRCVLKKATMSRVVSEEGAAVSGPVPCPDPENTCYQDSEVQGVLILETQNTDLQRCTTQCESISACTHASFYPNGTCLSYANVTDVHRPAAALGAPVTSPIPCHPEQTEPPNHRRKLLTQAISRQLSPASMGVACTKGDRKKRPFKNLLVQTPVRLR